MARWQGRVVSHLGRTVAVMSFRYRLYPESAEHAVMVSHGEQARLIWNVALEQMDAAHAMGLRCDWDNWDRQLTVLRNTEGLEWLREGASSVQQQALRQLRQAFRNFWANPAHYGRPRFRSKRRTRDGFVVRSVSVVKLNHKWSAVRIPKAGWVKFRRDRPLGDHGMAHVTRDNCGRWHVSFSAPQTPVESAKDSERRSVGIDRGITDTVATSDGELVNIPRASQKEVRQLKELQRRLARQQPGSNRRERTKDAIAKTQGRIADRRKDWVEKLSTKLVSDNAVIVFEGLQVKSMMRSASGTIEHPGSNVGAKRGLNAAITASCWGMLERRVRDKATASRTTVVSVPAAHTSQKCSSCGYTDRRNRHRKDFLCVACGHEDDADINAANNVLAAGLAVIRREGTDPETPVSGTEPAKRQPHLPAVLAA